MSTTTDLPFAGGELSSFDPQDNGCIEITSAGIGGTPFNPAVSRCAIEIVAGSNGFKSPTWAAASDFWFHGFFFSGVGCPDMVKVFDGATPVLTISTDSGPMVIKTRQSGVLTTVGTLTTVAGNNVLDIQLEAGAAGVCAGYLAGTEIFRVTGLDHSGFSGVTQIQSDLASPVGAGAIAWSQIICDNVPHVGDALVTIVEDTASAVNTGWFGSVANINETVLDDSHSVTSSTPGDISTYYKNGASLGTYNVVAICIGVRAQMTAGSSTNLQVALRTNGTNYFSPTMALDFGFQACCASWVDNPFTAAPWDPATGAAIEGGMKSIA